MNGVKSNLLEIKSVSKNFSVSKGLFGKVTGSIKAVDDVSLSIASGESFGIVGESGSGKTTLGRCIIRAIEPTNGSVIYNIDENTSFELIGLNKTELIKVKKYFHMIFQDPYSSLNPRMTVLELIKEPLLYNNIAKGNEANSIVHDILNEVGLEVKHAHRYAHAFSGGQRQRIGVARSLVVKPKLIICDEPVSALDVSIQAQILNLLQNLKEKYNLTYVFISHDLSVIKHITNKVAVMYVGNIIEISDTNELFTKPLHPYTEALLSSVPIPDTNVKKEKIILSGEIPNPANPPKGCLFHPRCKYVKDICKVEKPILKEIKTNHFTACHFSNELNLKSFLYK